MTMVVLVAPAAFKGSLGPRQVADALAAGVRLALPDARVLHCPISDGGDGLLEAVLPPESLPQPVAVPGPLGSQAEGPLGGPARGPRRFESPTACAIALLRPDSIAP